MTMLEYKFRLPPVGQIGMVVKDLDKTIALYSSCGLGPFRVVNLEIRDYLYRGKRGSCRLRVGMLDGPPISMELIQVLEGETPHSDFLREKGEGVQHFGIHVGDLEGTLAEFAKEGIYPVFRGSIPNINEFAYLDTRQAGGVMFELSQVSTNRRTSHKV